MSIDDAQPEEWDAVARIAAKKPRLTEWFDRAIEPYRSGVYEMLNESTGLRFYSYWSGLWWIGVGSTPDEAAISCRPLVKLWPWRGLMEQPK